MDTITTRSRIITNQLQPPTAQQQADRWKRLADAERERVSALMRENGFKPGQPIDGWDTAPGSQLDQKILDCLQQAAGQIVSLAGVRERARGKRAELTLSLEQIGEVDPTNRAALRRRDQMAYDLADLESVEAESIAHHLANLERMGWKQVKK